MSRVTYTNTPDRGDQVQLRAEHAVRLVTDAEEGTGVDALPGGVYGYTYSPGLRNAPLFATRRYRSYEVHKRVDGEAFTSPTPRSSCACRTRASGGIGNTPCRIRRVSW